MPEFVSKRINVDDASARGDNFEFLVVTHSMEAPIVTLADNSNYPHVRDVYARQTDEHHDVQGVHVSVRFESPPAGKGTGFSINLAQPGMRPSCEDGKNYLVIPLV
ncbi:hypothetical protein MOE20_01190 [Bacillus atrophaeus]|uniref:hypothetical protein n=1 Tax=Bacillus atrophaeus TaxID=1452 RepID=UPI00228272F0|nr:hypothetical protein [Bacillus atrophaeus]MCY8918029.1 hypothetical protein [Bacillus atrophaeus]MCY8923265.1 hypothetical protein [Bacillus atrophaeus]